MIGDTTSECDGVSATAVQSSSAFSAIDRGTGGVGIVEVCRGRPSENLIREANN